MIDQSVSKVEVKGFEARFYDVLMDLITFGKYKKFIYAALRNIKLKNNQKVIDFGCGTGRNILILNKYALMNNFNVKFVGVDKGKIMLEKAKKKTEKFSNIEIIESDIREKIDVKEKFDIGMISFVLHGFVQKDRNRILTNFNKLIKRNGKLYIIDYNEINVNKASFFTKFFYRKIECPLAEDFASRDLKKMLKKYKFKIVNEYFYFNNLIRVAEAIKQV